MLPLSGHDDLAMSTSVLKALPGKLDIKDTHLVFSIYCTSKQGPDTKPHKQ